jgi:predicted nucleic acid-binding protein
MVGILGILIEAKQKGVIISVKAQIAKYWLSPAS